MIEQQNNSLTEFPFERPNRFQWKLLRRHWLYKAYDEKEEIVILRAPVLHEAGIKGERLSFKDQKECYKEFRALDRLIFKEGFKGWISDTSIYKPHIFILFAKVGAQPYALVLDNKTIYFRKLAEGLPSRPAV